MKSSACKLIESLEMGRCGATDYIATDVLEQKELINNEHNNQK